MSRHTPTSYHAQNTDETVTSSQRGTDAGRYSSDTVQHLLDRAAYFNLYSSPYVPHVGEENGAKRSESGEARRSDRRASVIRDGRCVGFKISERLRPFEIIMQPPSLEFGLRASNLAGEVMGDFSSRWMLCPDDFAALPDLEPPPTSFNPTRRQRFVMLDAACSLGHGDDGFRGFGAGSTFPSSNGDPQVAAVGNLLEGRGRFRELIGTYVYCGTLSEEEGFRGSLMIRVMDPRGELNVDGSLSSFEGGEWPEEGVTYLMFRGQATVADKVEPIIGSDGRVEALNVAQQLRLFRTNASASGRAGLRSEHNVGSIIGEIDARIVYDPTAPGGGPLDPIPYTAFDEYKFTERDNVYVGSLFIDEGEGRTFNLQIEGAPGQPAIRFGGFGPILSGTNVFRGVEGLMTDNSVVSFTPHVSASVYVIRLNDPDGRFRA